MWQSGWEGTLGEKGYMYMCGRVPCCSPETFTTLLTGYTPIQNTKFAKNTLLYSTQNYTQCLVMTY